LGLTVPDLDVNFYDSELLNLVFAHTVVYLAYADAKTDFRSDFTLLNSPCPPVEASTSNRAQRSSLVCR
jgi:hypothetical protein